ncbi:MAG: SAM-dependent methyltransferase [Deltaproteobacteria bacterium]|nr:SAM-dependent methyltransferase [Deltaproteobacteria bacterium]
MKEGTRLSMCAGVFLVSLAALSFELVLSRLFSVALSHHFAFMVVSLALLGYGASGSFLTVFPSLLRKGPARLLAFSAMLFSITCVGAYAGANNIPFDPFRMSWDRFQLLYLLADYLLLSLPFFFSGLCVSAALVYLAEEAGTIYFFDLAGAGGGALLILVLFDRFGGQGAVVVPAMIAGLGGLIFGLRSLSRRWTTIVSSVVLASMALLLWMKPGVLETRISPYKSLKVALWHPAARILETRWNAFSRVDVVESPAVRFAPGLSLGFQKPLPPQLGVAVDGDNMTAITRYDGRKAPVAFVSHLPGSLAYWIGERDRVLVIDPGGGLDVLMGLVMGAKRIDAVFDNPLVLEMVSEDYGAFGGHLFRDPRVVASVKSGRSFLRQAGLSYDLIQYSPLSSLGASSTGIGGIRESYMFTVEAVIDAFNHLKPEGIFSVTQYLLPPPRQEIRLVQLVLAALARIGVPGPELHLTAIRSWGTFTLLLKRTPFSRRDIQRVKDFCERERFDTVYFPGIEEVDANRFNRFSRPIYFEMVRSLLSEETRKRLFREYLFDLRPVTDDDPFFFNFFRWQKMVPLYRAIHEKWQPFLEWGYLVPVVLVESIAASALLILLPLLLRKRSNSKGRRSGRASVLAYFASLGLGYMLAEIVLIQKLILFLDHPVYAMATVTSGLLVSSGIGSLLSQRVADRRLRAFLSAICFVVGLLIWGYLLILPPAVDRFLGFGIGIRVAIALLLVTPLGLVMGMPFPLGVRLLKRTDPPVIAWAWCANGCFSVIGAVLSAALALVVGFSGVFTAAGTVYLVGGVVSFSFPGLTYHGDEADTPQVSDG